MPNQSIEQILIDWNVKFPLDREYRKAHNIIFGSPQHREINQIDIYLQFVEDSLYEKFEVEIREEIKMEKDYKDGKWLRDEPDVEGKEADDLFAKLKVADMSNIKIED